MIVDVIIIIITTVIVIMSMELIEGYVFMCVVWQLSSKAINILITSHFGIINAVDYFPVSLIITDEVVEACEQIRTKNVRVRVRLKCWSSIEYICWCHSLRNSKNKHAKSNRHNFELLLLAIWWMVRTSSHIHAYEYTYI